MHKLGCPARNNPGYADCECAAMDQREHTEQLRIYNENAPRIEQLQAEIADLRERLERAESKLADPHELERSEKEDQIAELIRCGQTLNQTTP